MDMYAHVESFLEIRRHCEASSSTTMQKPLVKQWHGMFPYFLWMGGRTWCFAGWVFVSIETAAGGEFFYNVDWKKWWNLREKGMWNLER